MFSVWFVRGSQPGVWCFSSPTGEIRLDRKLRRFVTGNLDLKSTSYILLEVILLISLV